MAQSPGTELAWVMEMKLEVLLNVYLTWQLLVVSLLRQLRRVACFCGGFRVKNDAAGARRVGQVLNACSGTYIKREGGLGRQVGGDRRVGQIGDGSGVCR